MMDDVLELQEPLRSIAFNEFGETTALRHAKLQELREMIDNVKNVEDRIQNTSDVNLIRFLRARKYDLEKVLDATIEWQRFFNKHREVLQDIKTDDLKYIFSTGFLSVFEENDLDGKSVLIMRPANGISLFTAEMKRSNPRLLLQTNFWLFENFSQIPRVQVCGIVVINSFNGLSFRDQMAMSSMAPIMDQLATFQHFQILSLRLKGAYILEEPAFMSWLWFFIRPFMNEKIKSRFHLCGSDYSKLLSAFPDPKVLPTDLGGEVPVTTPQPSDWVFQRIGKIDEWRRSML